MNIKNYFQMTRPATKDSLRKIAATIFVVLSLTQILPAISLRAGRFRVSPRASRSRRGGRARGAGRLRRVVLAAQRARRVAQLTRRALAPALEPRPPPTIFDLAI